jgi:hypothetical protein
MRAQVLAALEESLAATPDPVAVLRGINTGIDRRRRRNRCYRVGFTVIAVVLLVIVAVSAQAQPPDQTPAVIPVGEWKNTIRPTWLPAGLIAQRFTATLTDESISYRSGDSNFSIQVGNGGLTHPGNAERISIGGRPAVAWSESTGTTLGFELPSGRWAMVALSWTRPAPELIIRDEAIRIARSIEETGDRLLRIGFAPSYLPAGHRVVGVETNAFTTDGFGTVVCAAVPGQGPGIRISMSTMEINKSSTVRVADIQGRPAYRSISGASLYVTEFNGGTLTIDATLDGEKVWPHEALPPAGILPLTELIKVAEGVRWIG